MKKKRSSIVSLSNENKTKVSDYILKTLNHSPTPIVLHDKQKRGDDAKLETGYEEELVIPATRKNKRDATLC